MRLRFYEIWNRDTFLINISLKNKLFVIICFRNNVKVFTVAFDQLNASLVKKVLFSLKNIFLASDFWIFGF